MKTSPRRKPFVLVFLFLYAAAFAESLLPHLRSRPAPPPAANSYQPLPATTDNYWMAGIGR